MGIPLFDGKETSKNVAELRVKRSSKCEVRSAK